MMIIHSHVMGAVAFLTFNAYGMSAQLAGKSVYQISERKH